MSNTILRNENVSVTLKSLGGELTSIKDASGTEYLWQGNPDFWSGQAPVLFPIVLMFKKWNCNHWLILRLVLLAVMVLQENLEFYFGFLLLKLVLFIL